MNSSDLYVDEETRARLGTDGLHEVSGHLWPGDCQTCGYELGTDWRPPALCVDDMMAFASASLHHPQCRVPGWNDESAVQLGSGDLLSWRAQALLLPLRSESQPSQPDLRPMLLVNPGLEMVFTHQNEQQQWQVRPYTPFVQADLAPVGQIRLGQPLQRASARVAGNDLVITVQDAGTYAGGVTPDARQILGRTRELGGALLGVTQAMDPSELTEHTLDRLVRSGRLIAGWVALGR